MSARNIAYVNTPGIDVTASSSSAATALPFQSSFILIKNVGANEAFVKTGGSTVSVSSASSANGMSIPAGAIETYRMDKVSTYIAAISTSGTTLRVYPTEGV